MADEERIEEKKWISRAEFVVELAWRTGLTVSEARSVTDVFLDILTDRFSVNQSVAFEGFGTFSVMPITERVGRNPRTREEHMIPAGYKPVFKAARGLRESITQSINEGTCPLPRQNLIREEQPEPRRRGRPRKEIPAPTGYGNDRPKVESKPEEAGDEGVPAL